VLVFSSITSGLGSGWDRFVHDLSSWSNRFSNNIGPLEVAALIVTTVAIIAWGVANLVVGSEKELHAALAPYRLLRREESTAHGEDRLRVPALKRVSAVLSTFAERRGFRDVLAQKLQRAGLPIGVGEFMTMWLLGTVILLVIGGFVGSVVGLIFAFIFAIFIPLAVLAYLADRRKRQFASQIPDVLKLLAASLRAGFSLLQGLDAILYQVKDPMASELRRAFAATRVGTPIEDALEAAADRVGSKDFSWTVMAIRIQREVGGNLAEILETVAETMTSRDRLRREVRTLTAEGRLSAGIVAALPFAIGALIYIVNRPYISTLFTSFGGQLAIIGGILLELAGVYWLYRIVQIEI
jgi:tight adherence protein B